MGNPRTKYKEIKMNQDYPDSKVVEALSVCFSVNEKEFVIDNKKNLFLVNTIIIGEMKESKKDIKLSYILRMLDGNRITGSTTKTIKYSDLLELSDEKITDELGAKMDQILEPAGEEIKNRGFAIGHPVDE